MTGTWLAAPGRAWTYMSLRVPEEVEGEKRRLRQADFEEDLRGAM
jgi:hypothetical protein